MNTVILIGRLTRDPEIRYTANGQMAVATFSVAVDRPRKQNGEKQADFPRVTVFGRQAENCEKYTGKGLLIGIQGRLQTGSYKNRDGVTVYTTDVVAEKVQFIEWKGSGKTQDAPQEYREHQERLPEYMPEDFKEIDEDVPF